MNYFSPQDQKEHERGNRGEDVEDRCRNCHEPFMAHRNGKCPEKNGAVGKLRPTIHKKLG